MRSFFLEYRDNRIHALRFGHGPELMIAFHGFGDRAQMFLPLEEALSDRYTVVAIDLPLHGQTDWTDDSFTKEDLLAIVDLIQNHPTIQPSIHLSLLGFSFGARLAIHLATALPDRVAHLILLSPDGLGTKGTGLAMATPAWLRRWLRRRAGKPERLLCFARRLHRYRLLPVSSFRFVQQNLARPERLQRAFFYWEVLGAFKVTYPMLKTIRKIDLIIGDQDEIIDSKRLMSYKRSLTNVRIHLIQEAKHRIAAKQLIQILQAL